MADFMRNNILHFVVFLISGLVLGSILTLKYSDHAGRTEIVFIAREELLNLEKERIKQTGEKDLFFGMIGTDLQKLIEEAVMPYRGKKVKILYSSYAGLIGQDVTSISKEVHTKIIQTLQARSVKKDDEKLEAQKTNKSA
jgi:hypothetical protein